MERRKPEDGCDRIKATRDNKQKKNDPIITGTIALFSTAKNNRDKYLMFN
jgi:hypothetical protein